MPLAPGDDFADIKVISVKFSEGGSHRRPHNQIFVGYGLIANTTLTWRRVNEKRLFSKER